MCDERKNKEGYPDFTAWQALQNIDSEERAKKLISVLKYIIRNADFELVERIRLRDKKTGKHYE